MIVSREREKLINAIVFFAGNTRYCGKIKLIKLLYLMDFACFRETGRSVTGLDYCAWKMGPVPFTLFQEWDEPEADLQGAIKIVPEQVIDYTRETVVPCKEFDDSHFTRRELRIMNALAARFRDDYSKLMVNVSHEESGPWAKIWDAGRGNNSRIPYSLAVPDNAPHREAILAAALDYENLTAASAVAH